MLCLLRPEKASGGGPSWFEGRVFSSLARRPRTDALGPTFRHSVQPSRPGDNRSLPASPLLTLVPLRAPSSASPIRSAESRSISRPRRADDWPLQVNPLDPGTPARTILSFANRSAVPRLDAGSSQGRLAAPARVLTPVSREHSGRRILMQAISDVRVLGPESVTGFSLRRPRSGVLGPASTVRRPRSGVPRARSPALNLSCACAPSRELQELPVREPRPRRRDVPGRMAFRTSGFRTGTFDRPRV